MTARTLARFLLAFTLFISVSDLRARDTSVSEIRFGSAPFAQRSPSIASDGETFLVVWEDRRRGGYEPDIFASRVSSRGEVLDPDGIPIAVSDTGESQPKVAWIGWCYVIGWIQIATDPSFPPTTTPSVHLVRVSRDGVVMDSQPKIVAPTARSLIDIVANGDRFLVVCNNGYVNGGKAIAFTPLLVQLETTVFTHTRVATAAGSEFFLFEYEPDPERKSAVIRLRRVSRDGRDMGRRDVASVPGNVWDLAVASNSTHHFIAYSSVDGEPSKALLASHTGDVAKSITLEKMTFSTRVVWNGTSYLVSSHESEKDQRLYFLHGRHVSADGDLVETEPFRITASRPTIVDASLGTAANRTFCFWSGTQGQFEPTDIVATEVKTAGGNEIVVSKGVSVQERPVMAAAADGYVVAWFEHATRDGNHVYASSLGRDGEPRATSMRLSDALGASSGPAVAFDGEGALVAWCDGEGGLVARRVSVDGVTAGDVLRIGGRFINGAPALASSGDVSLLVWATYDDIRAARITRNGIVLDPEGMVLASGPSYYRNPAVIWTGETFFVAWTEGGGICQITCPTYRGRTGTFAARVTRELSILDPLTFQLSEATTPPRLDDNDSEIAVAWRSERDGTSWTRRFRFDGEAVDRQAIEIPGRFESIDDVVWDGTSFIVIAASREGRAATVHGIRLGVDTPSFAFFVMVPPMAYPEGIPSQAPETRAVIGENGRLALVYGRSANEEPFYGVKRIAFRYPLAPKRARAARR